MLDRISPGAALGLGAFVVIAGVLAVVGVFAVGDHNYWGLTKTFELRAEFARTSGVDVGSRVRVQGMDAGVVGRVEMPTSPGDPVVLHLRIHERFQPLVRTDAVAELVLQGVLGQRSIEIQPGSPSAPTVADGALIASRRPLELNQVLEDAVAMGDDLRRIGGQAESILTRLDDLTARVQRGEGSLGQFVMSDSAHESTVQLMHSGDQLMSSLDETIAAFRRSWPLRGYFLGQGMGDPDEVLFRPNSERLVESLLADQLFPAGSSVLSTAGKQRLGTLAGRLKPNLADKAEIVVAVFAPTESNSARAQRLTQERASAVRDYLVNETDIARFGYFGRRTVTAAGFGNTAMDYDPSQPPADRIDLVVFTPRGS